ncbi:helix-turn-helix transcriptional regulator [Hafnia alvei]|nr:LuxR family transcriptional regulator [Hafnia alvei]
MIKILLKEYNSFQKLGLSSLISSQAISKNRVVELLSPSSESEELADILFHKNIVTVRLNKHPTNKKPKIYVPFLMRNKTVSEISTVIDKLLELACIESRVFYCKDELYMNLHLSGHMQISNMENNVMTLIGKGNSYASVAGLLNRSPKTISAHCRSITRKMGAANRAEFFQYASFIAGCENEEKYDLCL